MLKLGDEVTIVASTSGAGEQHKRVGRTSMITNITVRKNGTFIYGLKDIAMGKPIWSEDNLQPTGRRLLESSIGKTPGIPGAMATIDIDGEPHERRVHSMYAEYDIFGTMVGVYYVLRNASETITQAYVRPSREVKPTNTYTLF